MADGLQGAVIELPYPSVGATENALLTAVLARGTTLIKNAAVEPEVIDQVMLLQKMGAIIFVDTDRTSSSKGSTSCTGPSTRVINDRNEAASFAIAGIITGGDVLVEGAEQANMLTFLNKLRQVGAGVEFAPEGIRFFHPECPLTPDRAGDRRASRLHDRLATALRHADDPGGGTLGGARDGL